MMNDEATGYAIRTKNESLPYAYGAPPVCGVIRSAPEDFQVDEELGFVPSGEGEHVLVQIRKRGMNTPDVARLLARHAKVAAREVSYGGLKDKHAVTSQWFSITLPGKVEVDWMSLNDERLTVLAAQRHQRKLRRGALLGNRFRIVVRHLHGDIQAIPERVRCVKAEGVPNYFGEQRFGRDNVERARRMLAGTLRVKDRFEQGIYLSALRSQLFNAVLARRVSDDTWWRVLPGEAIILNGSRSFFVADTIDETLTRRLQEQDIHPSGPLCGSGELGCRGEALRLEEETLLPYASDGVALARHGLNMERRALRLISNDLHVVSDGNDLSCEFRLPAGAYATVVLREIIRV